MRLDFSDSSPRPRAPVVVPVPALAPHALRPSLLVGGRSTGCPSSTRLRTVFPSVSLSPGVAQGLLALITAHWDSDAAAPPRPFLFLRVCTVLRLLPLTPLCASAAAETEPLRRPGASVSPSESSPSVLLVACSRDRPPPAPSFVASFMLARNRAGRARGTCIHVRCWVAALSRARLLRSTQRTQIDLEILTGGRRSRGNELGPGALYE